MAKSIHMIVWLLSRYAYYDHLNEKIMPWWTITYSVGYTFKSGPRIPEKCLSVEKSVPWGLSPSFTLAPWSHCLVQFAIGWECRDQWINIQLKADYQPDYQLFWCENLLKSGVWSCLIHKLILSDIKITGLSLSTSSCEILTMKVKYVFSFLTWCCWTIAIAYPCLSMNFNPLHST